MCGLPVLVWSGLRWAVMGKFAVVSFGGYNLIGITGQFLDEEVVSHLDDDLQPLAGEALRRRGEIPADELPLEESDPLNYMRMEGQYDITIWRVFEPAARAFYDDPPTINSALKDLGVALARQHPRSYLVWLLKASRQALRKLVGDVLANPLGAVLVCLTVLTAFVRLVHLWWTGAPVTISGPMVETTLAAAGPGRHLCRNTSDVDHSCVPPVGTHDRRRRSAAVSARGVGLADAAEFSRKVTVMSEIVRVERGVGCDPD